MKKLLLLLFLTFAIEGFAQFNELTDPNKGLLTGGFGLSWINEKPYYAFRFRPEVAFAKFGIGLDLNLEFDASGKLRDENFKTAANYLSIIRYVRYGSKNEPVYVKVGALDNHTLGHGNIMFGYSNSASFDNRKTGIVVDLNMEKFGLESIYSDLSTGPVIGLRGYVRPLKFTSMKDIPIIGGLELGLSFVGDFNDKAGIMSSSYDPIKKEYIAGSDKKSNISVYGLDLGLPIFKNSFGSMDFFLDYAKIADFGSGVSTGVLFGMEFLGLSAQAKFERRFNDGNYMPSYFDAMYEIDRYRVDQVKNIATTKAEMLKNAISDNGWFGALQVNALGFVQIYGSYQRLDKLPESGMLRLWSNVTPESAPYVVKAGYDKVRIKNDVDMFYLDERSHLYIETGYKPMQYLVVSLVYHWTFLPIYDVNNKVQGYEPQKRIEPRVSFVYPLNFGGK